MKKLTETEKLKYWIDSEFTILHIMFAILMLQLTNGLVWTIILWVYMVWSVLYLLTRLAILASDDPNYLRVPKK